ncbi:GNAT family N-acetyltransferase [Kribbia dieselivorans]|uniref:GNAT family N-acetyltransferase n=1 Tax=Kribbia dieselivorans TaxID=331526 RepID=UPI000838D327|nr:GNAT family N-acetyltransferase [Kribbia dieselivorans]
MSVTVRDNPDKSRFEVLLDDEVAGFIDYSIADGRITMIHTEVDPKFNGRGLGRELVTYALEDARRRHLGVVPVCPYVRRTIAKNPEQYLDLVPADQRARFDLPAADGDAEPAAVS